MKESDLDRLKVAIATDSMTAFGGADRQLFSLLKIFPNAIIFTSLFDKEKYPSLKNEVRTSVLQPYSCFKRFLNIFTPIAFELFNFEGFDLVISLSAGSAKGIITQIDQKHLCILLTPPRHQWDRELNARYSKFRKMYSFASIFISHYLRLWDVSVVKRIDYIIAISKHIQKKIYKIYRRKSTVIYPGISKFWFEKVSNVERKKIIKKYSLPRHYLLYVGRLYDHKRVDWAINACLENDVDLVIVGNGPDAKYLKKIAGRSKLIHFLSEKQYVSDEDIRVIYTLADCFIFPPVEDFGYVPVESMACGTPVLAFNHGGAVETVKQGISGDLFADKDELSSLISKKVWKRYNKKDIITQAKAFSEEAFLYYIKKYVREIL